MDNKYLYDKSGKFIGKISSKPPRIDDSDLSKSTATIVGAWIFSITALGLFVIPIVLTIYLSKFLETQLLNGW